MPAFKLKLVVAPHIRLINFSLNFPSFSPFTIIVEFSLAFWDVFITRVLHHLIQVVIIVHLFPNSAPICNEHPIVGPLEMLILSCWRLDSIVPLSGHI